MYWGMGKIIMKAGRLVERHPQLFGTYITNFSCGPDSFVVGYFRDIMNRKPSLTLELDNHTADAGLETRVEAFLDIVHAYRKLVSQKQIVAIKKTFKPARTAINNGTASVITSNGTVLPMNDPRVTMLLPSMGKYGSEALAAIIRGYGFNAISHRPSDEAVLKLGRANTTCKECLPLILTTGTLLSYIGNGKRDDEVLVYFFATGSGPCRRPAAGRNTCRRAGRARRRRSTRCGACRVAAERRCRAAAGRGVAPAGGGLGRRGRVWGATSAFAGWSVVHFGPLGG